MIFLFSFLCTFNFSLDIPTAHDNFSGTYVYTLSTPDGQIEGAMELVKDGKEYTGSLTAYGQSYPMKKMVWDDHELTFEVDAAGYHSKIIGEFSDSTYEGVIHVEGMQIPIKATKK